MGQTAMGEDVDMAAVCVDRDAYDGRSLSNRVAKANANKVLRPLPDTTAFRYVASGSGIAAQPDPKSDIWGIDYEPLSKTLRLVWTPKVCSASKKKKPTRFVADHNIIGYDVTSATTIGLVVVSDDTKVQSRLELVMT
jgi:hypothetical protein